jgi:hypothetical protein
MKKKISVFRILLTILVISAITSLSLYLYIPHYIKSKINQEFKKRNIEGTYTVKIEFPKIHLINVDLNQKSIRIQSPKISVVTDGDTFFFIESESGEISGELTRSVKSESSTNKSVLFDFRNYTVKDLAYLNHVISGKINHFNAINGYKDILFSEVKLNILPNTEIFNLHVQGDQITLGSVQSKEKTEYLLDIIHEAKKDTTNPVQNESGSKYSIIVKEAFLVNDEFKIKAKNLTKDIYIRASELQMERGDRKVILTDLKLILKNPYYLSAKSITTRVEGISKSDIELEDVDVNVNANGNSYEIHFKMGDFKSSGAVIYNGSLENIDWKLERSGCQSLINSLPSSLRSTLDGFIFDGHISVDTKVNVKNPKASIKLVNNCKSIKYPDSFSKKALKSEFNRYVLDPKGQPYLIKSGPLSGDWISYGAVSKYLPMAIIACEDMGFYNHKGIHMEAIENSIAMNIKAGKFLRGGSTISMQTAKNLWLNREKTISRKIQEAFLTTHLESILTKEEIIELYMNIVEFSPGSYGIRKAAHHYFKTSASNLSLGQSILIALQLPNPKSISWNEAGNISANKLAYISQIIMNMEKRGMITPEEMTEAIDEDIVIGQPSKSKEYGDVVIPDGQEW